MMHRLLRGSPRLLGVASKRGNASWIVHTVPTPELTSDLVRRPLPKMMLGEVAKHRDEVAIVDGATGASLTFTTVHAHVCCLANALRRVLGPAGGPNACIGIVSPNHLNYFTIFNAIALVGARSTTLNPLCTEDDALYQLEATGCRAAFVHPACVAKVQAAVARMRGGGAAFTIISMDAAAAGAATSVDEMVAGERLSDIDEDSFLPQASFDPESILTIPFSSGTTGKPKGVVLTHRNVVSNILQSYPFEGEQLRPSAANNFKRGTMLVPLPFFHIFGLTSGMCIPFYMGAQMVFMPAFDLKHYLTLVQQYKVTRGFVVPPIVLALAKHPMVDEYDLSSLESLMSGAAPLGAEVQIAAASRLKCIIKQGWGMTETSPAGTITPDWLITTVADVAGISGKLVPGTEGKIVDPITGADMPPTEEGELLVRGPQVMKGYYNNEEATKATLRPDGWMHTGDIGRFNTDGWLIITDRSKELIKYKGFQVPPAELEALIGGMPAVKDVVVIPVPDDEAGELPRAYVVPQDTPAGRSLTEHDVVTYVNARVAPHKKLRGGCVFTDAVPKSASGKLLRRVQIQRDRERTAAASSGGGGGK